MSTIEISGNAGIENEEQLRESSTASGSAATVICADIGISEDLLNDEQTELVSVLAESDSSLSAPPPPPPTPVYVEAASNVLEDVASKLADSLEAGGVVVEKSNDEQWETPCAPPPPPPLPVDWWNDGKVPERGNTVEDAEVKLDNGKEAKTNDTLPEEVIEDVQKTIKDISEDANTAAAIPLTEPASSEPPKTSESISKPSGLKAENNNDDELLSLHVLSARSSTPYTQPIACTSFSCELGHIAESVSPVKDGIDDQKANPEAGSSSSSQKHRASVSKSETALRPASPKPLGKSKSCLVKSGKLRYDRADLLRIRNDVPQPAVGEYVKDSMHAMQVFSCVELEMQNKMRALNILKWSDQDERKLKLKSRQTEMMPSFYKRKYGATMDESIIQSYPPQPELKDAALAPNQRRIGSGRVQLNKYAYPRTPSTTAGTEKLLWKETAADSVGGKMSAQPFQPSSQTAKGQTGWEPKMANGDQRASKASYVKPVKSGFLFINEPKRATATGRAPRHSREQNEEPEWFSAGPTSRLDTIELHGFEEDERAESSEAGSTNEAERSSMSDTNNNAHAKVNGEVGKPFQFDEFAAAANQRRPNNNTTFYPEHQQYRKAPQADSKFLPFFGGTQPLTCEELEKSGSSNSLNDFFKKAMSVQPQPQPEKKEQPQQAEAQPQSSANGSANAVFFADQLEAKWRRNSLANNDANNNNMHRDKENFNKLIGQMNSNEGSTNSMPGPAAQKRAAGDNLASLLYAQQKAKQEHALQQQQMINQKQNLQYIQQQQTANLANFLQMRTILNRPEAQSLLLRLQKGEISKYGLVVQLSNPNLPKSDREAMTAVLTFTSIQQQQHQKQQIELSLLMNQLQNLRNLAIVQQTLSSQQQQLQQQQQQQSLTHGNRPPAQAQGQGLSANELRTHTNLVMQNALLNRKREEQQNLGMQNMFQSNANQTHNAGMNLQAPTSPGAHRLPVLQSLFTDTNNARPVQNMPHQTEAPRNNRGNYLHQRRRFHNGNGGGSQMKLNLGAEHQQNRIWNGMNAPRHQPNLAFSCADELH